MSKYTDGPWEVDPDDRPGMDYNNHVISAQTSERICFMAHGGPSRQDEYDANARLIAAAPDLLEALKAVLPEGWGDDDTMDHIPGVKQARAAIAKALGGTP